LLTDNTIPYSKDKYSILLQCVETLGCSTPSCLCNAVWRFSTKGQNCDS